MGSVSLVLKVRPTERIAMETAEFLDYITYHFIVLGPIKGQL